MVNYLDIYTLAYCIDKCSIISMFNYSNIQLRYTNYDNKFLSTWEFLKISTSGISNTKIRDAVKEYIECNLHICSFEISIVYISEINQLTSSCDEMEPSS